MPVTPAWSTCTSSGCAPRSRTTPRTPGWSRPSAGSATGSARRPAPKSHRRRPSTRRDRRPQVRQLRPPRLDLRARVVLFCSAVAVCALLLLGLSLRAVLARSLYGQQHSMASRQVKTLVPRARGDLAGLLTGRSLSDSDLQKLIDELNKATSGGPPPFNAVVVRDPDSGLTKSSDARHYPFGQVPTRLANQVPTHDG